MAASHQDLATSIIKFLQASVADKTVSEDFSESIDVAIDCIADAFEVNKADAEGVDQKLGGSLLQLVNGSSGNGSKATTGAKASVPPTANVSAETKAQADALKAEGNKAMAGKDFTLAIDKYTQAIDLDGSNVVYLSNRAAAYSSASQHAQAVADAKRALELDPNFAKAYSRLGLAQYALGNAKDAMDAYKKGMEVEGANPTEAMKRGYETAKKRVEEELESSIASREPESSAGSSSGAGAAGSGSGAGNAPDLSSMFGGGGMPDLSSMFGGGGMPDLSAMMNNPQVMQAAQSMMQNPEAMQGLMNNPMVRQMANSLGGEGGLDNLQNMARQFMGNQGQGQNQNQNNES